ncbi:MAG: AIR synthase-related protein, partial [Planctomycetota bacterium]
LCEGLLRARDKHLYRGLTDCGAGGLSSAIGEMGEKCGALVELDKVPLKYPGLSPDEIWISEAQERMVMAVPPEKLDECLAVFAEDEVEATVIGSFTDTGRLELRYEGTTVCDLSMEFLHDGTPKPVRTADWRKPELDDPGCPPCEDWSATLLSMVGSPNVNSREWIIRQYDHEVQGMSVVKPLVGLGLSPEETSDEGEGPAVAARGPSDGSVLKPLADSPKGVALGCGANPDFGLLDPGAMAEAVIDEALRNVVAVGGDPDHTSLLDNFSWGNCDEPDRLGALVLAAKGCYRAAVAYGTPFISGKDSLNNEYRVDGVARSIPPTLFASAMSIVPDAARAVTMDAKRPGARLYLVGTTKLELGGALYLTHQNGTLAGRVPRPDLTQAPSVLRAVHAALKSGLALSCHDLSEGGLAVAAAEMAFAGGVGIEVDLERVPVEESLQSEDPEGVSHDAVRAFSESCTRFLIEVDEAHAAAFEQALGQHAAQVGQVLEDPVLRLLGRGEKTLCQIPVSDLARAHRSGFQG